MTTQKRRRRGRGREWAKNLLILFLALSAVYLTLRTGLYTGWSGAEEGRLMVDQGGNSPAQPAAAALPVRMAVNSEAGRYGVQYDAGRSAELFEALGGVLGEGLSSARNPRTVPEARWREALGQPGIYLEFSCGVPLEALCVWLGEGSGSLGDQARRLLLAHGGGDAVTLYYSNEADGLYYACDTAISYVGHLRDAVERCAPNGAVFAFEYGPEEGYGSLDPYVLLLSAPPSPAVYQAVNPVSLEDSGQMLRLQQNCGFPAAASGFYQSGDSLVVRDGGDSLRIGEDGAVTFTDGGGSSPRYPAGSGLSAKIETCRALAQATVGASCGEARLSLTRLSAGGESGSWEICFGYVLDGAPVQLYDEGYAARFVIRNGRITQFVLRFRSYTAAGEQSIVLRELQAAAALEAQRPAGRELILCYEDSGGDTVRAGWVAR